MSIRAGSARQKAILLVLLAVYAGALAFSVLDKRERVGHPDVGWVADMGGVVSPSRVAVSELGLRGGGRALAVNGVPVDPLNFRSQSRELVSLEPGARNTLRFERLGEIRELTIPVATWTWRDALFTHGAIDLLAALFMATALTSFALRPYETTSWAILTLASVTGSLITVSLLPEGESTVRAVFQTCLAALAPFALLHAGLAFPVVQPALLRRGTLWALYALGGVHCALQLEAWSLRWWGPFRHFATLETVLLSASVAFFVARSSWFALRSRDPLVAQRGRILLAAGLLGGGPPAALALLRDVSGWFAFDTRMVYWAMALFFLPLGYISVRQSLVNARAAARQAVAYAGVAALLTALGLVLVAVQAYALVLLLFPLLYWWPRFQRRLSARIYPKRARFPELLQELGAEFALCAAPDQLLDLVADAPGRLCDARSSVAFLLPDSSGSGERVRSSKGLALALERPLAGETLVKLMETTRRAILRDQIAVEPQYANIEGECYAGFDRLDAELLVPILRDDRAIGGIAVGPTAAADPYEPPEIAALEAVAHQAAQAVSRVEALQRLQARETEVEELKRFFPSPVIDQIMAKGGAGELQTARKLVTVFFADLRGFTSFAEGVEPEEVIATLAEYHGSLGGRIAESGGTLERFTGDGFMVFFNDPVDQPDHVQRALNMALAMREDVEGLRRRWLARGYDIHVGFGLHTGYATVGFIGYEERRDYAVIGSVTNLAARLSDAAKGGEILISAAIHAELKGGFRVEPAGTLELKGVGRPQAVFRVLGRS